MCIWIQTLAEFEMFTNQTKFSILLIYFSTFLFLFSQSLSYFVNWKSLFSNSLRTNCSQIFNLSNIRKSFSSVNLMFCCSLPIISNKICVPNIHFDLLFPKNSLLTHQKGFFSVHFEFRHWLNKDFKVKFEFSNTLKLNTLNEFRVQPMAE